MLPLVDPRRSPEPPQEQQPARLASSFDELAELLRLCREGRLYDVERWIANRAPLQVANPTGAARRWSPMGVALERRDHALTLLLLCNGYDPDLDAQPHLTCALESGREDLVHLLLTWGADPRHVDLDALMDTHNSALFERFYTLGVDFAKKYALARALAYHTSNKPLFGFVKRHRASDPAVARQLDTALTHHAGQGNEKGVLLCLWAGADPRGPAAWLNPYRDYQFDDHDDEGDEDEEDAYRYTALRAACRSGHAALVKRFGLDPSRDNFDALFRGACNPETIDLLAEHAMPTCAEDIVLGSVPARYLSSETCDRTRTLARLFELGMTWESTSAETLAQLRRDLLRLREHEFRSFVVVLAMEGACAPEITRELGRTAGFERKLTEARLLPVKGARGKRSNGDARRVAKAFRPDQ